MSHQGPIPYLAASIAAAGVIGTAYCAYSLYKKPRLPEKWTQVGKLSSIHVYPIKSCGPALNVDDVECTELGLRSGWLRDRVLMVIDEKNNFITARAYPELLLVHPTVRSSILSLQHKDMETVYINLAEVIAVQKPMQATVWGTTVPAYDCGAEVSAWFSKLLDRPENHYRLVYYASQKSRYLRIKATDRFYNLLQHDTGAFPDELSFNLINQASVDDLNTRLTDCQASPKNFRPNFVVTGPKAYDEDNWKYVKIGENVFEIIKPCTRCVLTTIDPETGVRNVKAEPLETLKSYRQIIDPEERRAAGSSPRMGLQMALRSGPGTPITVDDTVYVA